VLSPAAVAFRRQEEVIMLSERQRETFADRGLIRLEGLIPEPTLAPARKIVGAALEREGLQRDGRWLAEEPEPRGFELATRITRKLKPRVKSDAFRSLVTDRVLEAAVSLAGGRELRPIMEHPQLLFTPPNATEWTVPHKIWHLDVPRMGELGLVGVQMFTFLEPVAPGAGGTLVVAGSHRLLGDRGRVSSKDVKKLLKKEPYFRELFAPGDADRRRFIDEVGRSGGVELQVVELFGEPGDVFLTDLRLLHTLAPNASRSPRLMLTQRFFLGSMALEIYAGRTKTA